MLLVLGIHVQGFKRNQEGNLLPMFSKGTTLCSLCGQMKPNANVRDTVDSTQSPDSPASPRALPSFIPVEDYVIHQSIVQVPTHWGECLEESFVRVV
jgi:hypothetical protein